MPLHKHHRRKRDKHLHEVHKDLVEHEAQGHLVEYLAKDNVELDKFPDFAERALRHVLRFLRPRSKLHNQLFDCVEVDEDDQFVRHVKTNATTKSDQTVSSDSSEASENLTAARRNWPGKPSPEAHLLANYLKVRTSAAVDVLNRTAMDIMVFKVWEPAKVQEQDASVSRPEQKMSTLRRNTRYVTMPLQGNFPKTLPGLYCQRLETFTAHDSLTKAHELISESVKSDASELHSSLTQLSMQEPVCPKLQTFLQRHCTLHIGEDGQQMLRKFTQNCATDLMHSLKSEIHVKELECKWDRDSKVCDLHHCQIPTSDLLQIDEMTSKKFRELALLHKDTKHLVYLYQCEGFDEVGGFLCLSAEFDVLAINTIHSDRGFTVLTCGDGQILQDNPANDSDTHQFSTSAILFDPTTVSWHKVIEEVLKHKGAVEYCFIKPQQLDDCADQWGFVYKMVNHRGEPRYVFFPIEGVGEIESRATIANQDQIAIVDRDALERNFHTSDAPERLGELSYTLATSLTPVKFAKLMVADVLHPVVIHSLATTVCSEVIDTIPAMAIVQGAWFYVRNLVFLEMLSNIVCIIAVAHIVKNIKGRGALFNITYLDWTRVVFFFWLRALLVEVCRCIGYVRYGWKRDYFTSIITWKTCLGLVVIAPWALWRLHYSQDPETARVLLAVLAMYHWVEIISLCSGLRLLIIGRLIMPVLETLREAVFFGMVMILFLVAYAQASYAMSPNETSFRDVLYASYLFGLLNHFEREDVLRDEDRDTSTDDQFLEEDWARIAQYASFIIAGLVIAVALANIFIGIMSSSFEFNLSRVDKLLIQRRAQIALDMDLRKDTVAWLIAPILRFFPARCTELCQRRRGAGRRQGYLYYCQRREVNDDAHIFTQEKSGRQGVERVFRSVAKLRDEVRQHVGRPKEGNDKASRIGTQLPSGRTQVLIDGMDFLLKFEYDDAKECSV